MPEPRPDEVAQHPPPGLDVSVQRLCAAPDVPAAAEMRRWARAALPRGTTRAELTLRITDEAEMRLLNRRWRGIDRPTNVLSFPLGAPGAAAALIPVGDVVLCAPLIRREAVAAGKSPAAHWAHIIIHGILHVMGYDHAEDEAAKAMQEKETAILNRLGFPGPYPPAPPRPAGTGGSRCPAGAAHR